MRVKPGWWEACRVYTDPRVLAVLLLGFSSGLPLLLTLGTLSIWLAESGISKTAIGLFALVGVPYSVKFLWAPFMDRLTLPWLTQRFGRRRGWALATQALLMVSVLGLGQCDPLANPELLAVWALVVTFASASQDIVIDAYRVEILEERQYGAGAATYVGGYRLGMLVAGAGALYLAEAIPWSAVYAVMAALVLVGIGTVLVNPEPESAPMAGGRTDTPALWLREAVIAPFADFALRRDWLVILVFVALYKFGDSLAGVMANPFISRSASPRRKSPTSPSCSGCWRPWPAPSSAACWWSAAASCGACWFAACCRCSPICCSPCRPSSATTWPC